MKRGTKFSKTWVGGAIFIKIRMGNQKGEGGGNAKVTARCDFFILIFSLLATIVTNTVFRKSSLENPFLVVPATSYHWTYHTDLLVFCLKFRLAPVCEYLNYYYNITDDY